MDANSSLVMLFCLTLRSIIVDMIRANGLWHHGGYLGASRWSLHHSLPAIAYILMEDSRMELNVLLFSQIVPRRAARRTYVLGRADS